MKTIKTHLATARAANTEAYLFGALRALCCSADFQSAVLPTCSRRSVESVPRTGVSQRLAECNSAIQQITTLRYDWALNTYTVAATDSANWAPRPAVAVRAATARVATARSARSMTPRDLTWEPETSISTNHPVSLGRIPKLSESERGIYAASLSLSPHHSVNSSLVGSCTLKRPDRRRAEAALWRAAKAEGRAPT